jgi:hypothetical protein
MSDVANKVLRIHKRHGKMSIDCQFPNLEQEANLWIWKIQGRQNKNVLRERITSSKGFLR